MEGVLLYVCMRVLVALFVNDCCVARVMRCSCSSSVMPERIFFCCFGSCALRARDAFCCGPCVCRKPKRLLYIPV